MQTRLERVCSSRSPEFVCLVVQSFHPLERKSSAPQDAEDAGEEIVRKARWKNSAPSWDTRRKSAPGQSSTGNGYAPVPHWSHPHGSGVGLSGVGLMALADTEAHPKKYMPLQVNGCQEHRCHQEVVGYIVYDTKRPLMRLKGGISFLPQYPKNSFFWAMDLHSLLTAVGATALPCLPGSSKQEHWMFYNTACTW
jgi:hypothetical protein